MSPVRALGLLSGGLDSALATRMMLDQGIEVIGLHLESPTACRSDVRALARELGIRLETREKGAEYLRILRSPRWGYGRNMNPCVDCRIFMFEVARGMMAELDARFLFTGEVAGQRPMSQGKPTLGLIDRQAGLQGQVLRPLSALLLPETEAERLGWIDRSRLLGICGRGRQEQLEMARQYGLEHVESPGGGCLLTDARFSAKLKDLFDHAPEERTSMDDVALLRVGRHFRIDASLKIVLGRNADENRRLLEFEDAARWAVVPEDFSGPIALVCGAREEAAVTQAADLIARHSKAPWGRIRWREGDETRYRQVSELISVSSP